MIRAYADDYNFLRIESDLETDSFKILCGQNICKYKVRQVEAYKGVYVHELELQDSVELGSEYLAFNKREEHSVVKMRQIIRTKRFEEETYFDDKLGFSYTKEATTFRCWAPTSTTMILELRHPDIPKKREIFNMTKIDSGVFEVVAEGDYENWRYSFLVENEASWKETLDPYAIASGRNSMINFVIDLEKTKTEIAENKVDTLPIDEAIIYELHIRDFSSAKNQAFKHKGKFLSFTEEGLVNSQGRKVGIDYLVDLGITHVQILPIADFSSVSEFEDSNNYNWGYDVEQYNVVEGRYSTNPMDPYARICELKKLVKTLKEKNIGVILDVVYNHVYLRDSFSFQKLFPGYFFRTDEFDQWSNGSGVGNDVASEKPMVRKFIIDSLKYWLSEFQVSGFRFDLMGILDIKTMEDIEVELKKINPNVYLYGEGWELNTSYNHELLATQINAHKIPRIGFFNDFFRDTIKGNNFNNYSSGLATGNTTSIYLARDVLCAGVMHNRYANPFQSINYISCHDNLILFDRLKLSAKDNNELKHFQKLAFTFLLLAQGVPMLHAGDEFSRTKKGIENSYNADDEINQIDWELLNDNEWLMAYVRQLIILRKEHYCFRLKTYQEIEKQVRVLFENNVIYYHINNPDEDAHFKDYMVIFNLNAAGRDVYFKHSVINLLNYEISNQVWVDGKDVIIIAR